MHQSIYHYIPSIEPLSFDGRNLYRWSKTLDFTIYNMLNLRHYFSSATIAFDPISREEDKLVVRLIYETIPESIKDHIDKIGEYPCSSEIFDYIQNLFENEEAHGRTAQIRTWTRLLNQRFDLSVDDLTEHINRINHTMDKLDSQGFTWTKDSMAGILYQLTIPVLDGFNLEGANQKLDLRWSCDKSPFKPEEIIRAIQSEVNIKKNIHGVSNRPISKDGFVHLPHQTEFDHWINNTIKSPMKQGYLNNIGARGITADPMGGILPGPLMPMMYTELGIKYPAPRIQTTTQKEEDKSASKKFNGLHDRISTPYTSDSHESEGSSTEFENDESDHLQRGTFDTDTEDEFDEFHPDVDPSYVLDLADWEHDKNFIYLYNSKGKLLRAILKNRLPSAVNKKLLQAYSSREPLEAEIDAFNQRKLEMKGGLPMRFLNDKICFGHP
ncbi:hypothetical protein DFH28DRAFT_953181 [Melampsora americana]|nr:hypothetical protein DFH28DRAFT_953181 [Melampsora americana]